MLTNNEPEERSPIPESTAPTTPPRFTSNVTPARHVHFATRTIIALALAGTTIGGGVVGAGITAAALHPAPAVAAASTQNTAATVASDVYQKTHASIVQILVSTASNFRGQSVSGSGSGIVIDADGYILTNAHVVDSASSVRVLFSSGDERTAQVVGTDTKNDLAVIKVDLPANTPVATLANSDNVQVGDIAIAIGSPFGLSETVTQGIISAVHRDWQPDGGTLQRDLIQTDAPINPGNSGGALLNASGEVIGVTAEIESPVRGSVGVGFAIPINTAKAELDQLKSGAQITPVWLGISGQEITPDLAQAQHISEQRGVWVAEVADSSPAAKAGVQANDVITALDGSTITTFDQLSTRLGNHKVGDNVKLTVKRGERSVTLTVTLQARPTDMQ